MSANRPGGNPGANGWFLWSAPTQMPPRRGGISSRWHLWEIDLRFALNSTPGWFRSTKKGTMPRTTATHHTTPSCCLYRGTSLKRKRTPLGYYHRPMPRVLGGWATPSWCLYIQRHQLGVVCAFYRLRAYSPDRSFRAWFLRFGGHDDTHDAELVPVCLIWTSIFY